MSKDVGIVPKSIRDILEYVGFVNGALANISDAEITAIEQDVKKASAKKLSLAIQENLKKFDSPSEFHFLSGDRAIIKLIAGAVKKRGINYYFKKNAVCLSNGEIGADPVSTIRQKIISFYRKR